MTSLLQLIQESDTVDLKSSLSQRAPWPPFFNFSILCDQMQQKVVTSAIFGGKKEGYGKTLNQPFANSRLGKYTLPCMYSFRFKKSQRMRLGSIAFADAYSPIEVLVTEGHKTSRCQWLLHRVVFSDDSLCSGSFPR